MLIVMTITRNRGRHHSYLKTNSLPEDVVSIKLLSSHPYHLTVDLYSSDLSDLSVHALLNYRT